MNKLAKNYTKEQFETAKNQNIMEYIRAIGIPLKKEGVSLFRAKEFGNLVINENKGSWYLNDLDLGSRSPIELAKRLFMLDGYNENEALVKAVHDLYQIAIYFKLIKSLTP